MRIAFVGKGGSGKSTLTASFASYLLKDTNKPVVVFDADLNIHAPELLGLGSIDFEKHLSNPSATEVIKRWLIGKNEINNFGEFKKTTPPTLKSNIFNASKLKEYPFSDFGLYKDNLSVFAVGTYQEEGIGASCYHNNLSILESLLNHTDDKGMYIVADMVAGVDSFAGTLHAQFDLTCFIVEPTKRSIEVYKKYKSLSDEAGVSENLLVLGNKVRSETDKEFIEKNVGEEKIIGYFTDDKYIRHIDQTEESLDIDKLDKNNKEILRSIESKFKSLPDKRNERLKKIWELHKKYVSQTFVKERFGDLTNQIDFNFSFDE